jgi:hypothetical protein
MLQATRHQVELAPYLQGVNYFCPVLPKPELSHCLHRLQLHRFQLHRPRISGPQMLASGTNQNFLTSACFSVSFQPQEFLPLRIFIVTIAAILLLPAISSILSYSGV